jgi:hypothetical protein
VAPARVAVRLFCATTAGREFERMKRMASENALKRRTLIQLVIESFPGIDDELTKVLRRA